MAGNSPAVTSRMTGGGSSADAKLAEATTRKARASDAGGRAGDIMAGFLGGGAIGSIFR